MSKSRSTYCVTERKYRVYQHYYMAEQLGLGEREIFIESNSIE